MLAAATTCVVFIALITRVYQKRTNAICKSKKLLNGKTVIITGGTAGMGLEMAKDFATRRAKVIIASPFVQEGNDAINRVIDDTGNRDVIYKHLDLASFKSVRQFAKDILKNEDRLDILINNAGVGFPPDVKTVDGLSFVMQVNYFGQFLLTLLLLPLLKRTGTDSEPTRIVNVSSILHNVGTVNLDTINKTRYWYKIRIYSNSKLCMTMFTREMSKKLSGSNVVVNSVDPGAVGTHIFDTCGMLLGFILRVGAGILFKTPWEGAQTALHVALDDNAGKTSGELYKNCDLSTAVRTAYDDEKCKQLWEESVKLVKLENVGV